MNTSRVSNIGKIKENLNELSIFANKTGEMRLNPKDNLRKGLSIKTSKSEKTPRRALGDVKNVQFSSFDSIPNANEKKDKKSKIPIKKSINVRKTKMIPKETILEEEKAETLPAEKCTWKEPGIDTFDDILGPISTRLSSISTPRWNQLLLPDMNKLFQGVLDLPEGVDVDQQLDMMEKEMDLMLFNGVDPLNGPVEID